MADPGKADLPVRVPIHRIKKLCCLIASVLFAIGILGNLPEEYLAQPFAAGCEAGLNESFREEQNRMLLPGGSLGSVQKPAPDGLVQTGNAADSGGLQQQYAAERVLKGVDAFRLVSPAGSAVQHACHGVRIVSVIPFVKEGGQFFFPVCSGRRLWQRIKRIRLFCVVAFIHQTDGKKKSCFA